MAYLRFGLLGFLVIRFLNTALLSRALLVYHNLSQIWDVQSPARAYQSAIPRANCVSALITRADRSARETPEKRRAEMTLCTAAGPLGCWYVHLKFAGSIHHCACTSVVYSASARCESTLVAQTRRFLLRPP